MVECDDITRIRSENVLWTCHASQTLSQILISLPIEPTLASTESVKSGTDAEGDMLRDNCPELTDSAVEQSSSNSAKTYPKHSRNPVERYEPT